MGQKKILANRLPWLQRALTVLGLAGLLGATAPAQAAVAGVEAERQQLESRVVAVRAALQSQSDAEPNAVDADGTRAQWFNWPNWGNWNNWPNWNNWGNWFNR